MSADSEPPGGLSVERALQFYVSPFFRQNYEQSCSRIQALVRKRADAALLDAAKQQKLENFAKLADELRDGLKNGTLLAWGSRDSPEAKRRKIACNSKNKIEFDEADPTIVTSRGRRIWAVRIYRTSEIAEWSAGVTLPRAAELLELLDWRFFTMGWADVLEHPQDEDYLTRVEGPCKRIVATLLRYLRAGSLELRTYRSIDDPAAQLVAFSKDRLDTLLIGASDLKNSLVRSPDGHTWKAWVFRPGAQNTRDKTGEQESRNKSSVHGRVHIKAKIAAIWNELSPRQKALVKAPGGKTRLLEILRKRMPERVEMSSLRREFLQFRKEENIR